MSKTPPAINIRSGALDWGTLAPIRLRAKQVA